MLSLSDKLIDTVHKLVNAGMGEEKAIHLVAYAYGVDFRVLKCLYQKDDLVQKH